MIDRITIYINDVELDDVKDRLSLSLSGIAKDESYKYASTIKNLKISYEGRQLKNKRLFAQICQREQLFFVYL